MGVSWLACINQIKLAILFRSVIKCRCFLTRPTQHWEKTRETHWVDKLILWICKQPCKQLTTTILLIHLNTKTIHKNWLLYNVIILTLKNGYIWGNPWLSLYFQYTSTNSNTNLKQCRHRLRTMQTGSIFDHTRDQIVIHTQKQNR